MSLRYILFPIVLVLFAFAASDMFAQESEPESKDEPARKSEPAVEAPPAGCGGGCRKRKQAAAKNEQPPAQRGYRGEGRRRGRQAAQQAEGRRGGCGGKAKRQSQGQGRGCGQAGRGQGRGCGQAGRGQGVGQGEARRGQAHRGQGEGRGCRQSQGEGEASATGRGCGQARGQGRGAGQGCRQKSSGRACGQVRGQGGQRQGAAQGCAAQTAFADLEPASEAYLAALASALEDELYARDYYLAAAKALPGVRRFSNLARAEQNHANMVAAMIRALGGQPDLERTRAVETPETLAAADTECRKIENHVIEAYARLIKEAPADPIRTALSRIQASNHRHLAAVGG